MNFIQQVGAPTRVSASGVTVISSGAVSLVGITVASVLTAQSVQIFTQTAGSITGTPVVGTMTLLANSFYPFPISMPNGLTFVVSNEDVDLTLYWNRAGR